MGKNKKIDVSWILNKYRKYIENKLDYLLDELLLLEDSKELKGFAIEEIQKKYPTSSKSINLGDNTNRIKKEHFQEYSEKLFDHFYSICKENESINKDENIKLRLFFLIHRNCLSEMKDKDAEEFLHIIFSEQVEDKEAEFFVIKVANNKGVIDSEIITKDVPESVEDIKNEKTRMLFLDAILNILQVDELGDLIETKYPENAYSEISEKFQYLKERDEKKFEMAVKEYFAKNLQLLDKTSLLLNTAARIMLGVKMASGENINNVELNEIDEDKDKDQVMKSSIDFVRGIYEELTRNCYDKSKAYQIFDDDGNELIFATRDEISRFLQRCTESKYITDEEIENIHDDLKKGILVEDIEKRKIANINVQDLINISESYSKQTNEDIKKRILECSKELYDYLKDSEQLDSKRALDLFLEGSLSLEIIKNTSVIEEFSEEEYNEQFKALYKTFKDSVDEEDKTVVKEKLKRFSNLYKDLLEDKKVSIDNLIINLITEHSGDAELDIMDMLYDLRLVSIDKAVEWIGTPILFRICEKEKLPPAKVKELFDNKSLGIDINVIADIINACPDMSQKFMLIISIFPEDEENRNKLYKKCLSIEPDAKTEVEGLKRKKGEGTKEYEKHEIDPAKRMKSMSLLDKEYYFEMTLDGHAIVHVPNLGEVIVEKMFNEKKEPSYGAATYIIDEEYFDENKDSIIQDGKVIRKELIKNRGVKVFKVNHCIESWGRKIKEHFGIEEGSRYSKEDIEEIDKAIEDIIKSQNQIGENK